jgi:hypothetical protein
MGQTTGGTQWGTLVHHHRSSPPRLPEHRTSAAACHAINRLEAIPDRRKAVIYVRNGYVQTDVITAEVCDEIREVISAARRAGVRIFAIDGRLLSGFPSPDPNVNPDEWQTYWSGTQASLRALSHETGGFAFVDSATSKER